MNHKLSAIGLGYVGLPLAYDSFRELELKRRDRQVLFNIKAFIEGKVDGRL